MTSIGESVVTSLVPRLVDKAIKEVNYLRFFETHVHNFVIESNCLVANQNRVQKDIEEAKRNYEKIEDEVKDWMVEAGNVIQENAKIKQAWYYGWCPYWRYRQGKRLARRTLAIKDHIQKSNFTKVARQGELPGINYHTSADFIDFESRKSKFKQLVEALEDGNQYIIGLQGMGGTGKTTLATQAGKQVKESKAFEKVIFVVVSDPPDIKKIRDDIARQLGLDLEQRVEVERSKLLWSRISNNGRKLLIILDDVWRQLDLRDIGIPLGSDNGNCYVLITTRHSKVCKAMRCQQTIHLQTLTDKDALDLFLVHTRNSNDSPSSDLKGLARDFVKECGGLPIAIVALASTLRNWPLGEWKVALTTLQNSELLDVDEDLVEVYKCLRLSYDNLRNPKAKQVFLMCSMFPEDYEIPINFIIRLGIGVGIFEEVDRYYVTRSQALGVKNELIASSLLLKVDGKQCVKMHDLVREVALWLAEEDIQVIMNSRMTLKSNKRFLFWSTDDFPNPFDGMELEIFVFWINGKDLVNNPEAFFARMTRLKVLLLFCRNGRELLILSLSQSLLSLKSI